MEKRRWATNYVRSRQLHGNAIQAPIIYQASVHMLARPRHISSGKTLGSRTYGLTSLLSAVRSCLHRLSASIHPVCLKVIPDVNCKLRMSVALTPRSSLWKLFSVMYIDCARSRNCAHVSQFGGGLAAFSVSVSRRTIYLSADLRCSTRSTNASTCFAN